MGSYYYLISGLPEVKLSDSKAKYDINEITQNILSNLSNKDIKLFNYFIYQNDNKNLVNAIANSRGLFSPYFVHLEPSIFSKEEIQKYANLSNLPNYMVKFLEDNKNTEWENIRHIENNLLSLYYEEMIQTGNAFIREYALFMRNLKNILAALNGKALGFSGDEISKELVEIKWDAEAAEKGGYEHFMMKEIHEQPKAIKDTLNSVLRDNKIDLSDVNLSDDEIIDLIENEIDVF